MSNRKTLISAVRQRLDDGVPIIEALVDVATVYDARYDYVASLWEQETGFPPAQQLRIDFLSKDHGPATIRSLTERHPLWETMELRRGDLIAEFPTGQNFLIFRDGRFVPGVEF